MSMMPIELSLYEALTEAGVKPDAARRVERQLETAIAKGQEAVRAEMHEQVMTKADGVVLKNEIKADIAALEARLHKSLTEQTWKMMAFMFAVNGMLMAFFKYIG
jgi:DnaJ-domain-containing protein 1